MFMREFKKNFNNFKNEIERDFQTKGKSGADPEYSSNTKIEIR
jgi:Sec-independent protein translocase protein TatA